MKSDPNPVGAATAKLAACLLILVCVAVGAVGLILPIIPGLLFLAIAALVAAKHSSTFARWLRRNQALSVYLARTDGVLDLSFRQKVRLGCLLSLKMLIDGVAFAMSTAARLSRAVRARD